MKRIISRIDIKNDWVVKGIHLEGLRAIGAPEQYSKSYYADGADEILLMDIVASLYERNALIELVKDIAKDVFIPITLGGGLRTLDDISAALNAGADKVTINTAAHKRPDFISEAANKFGSSTIVVAVEAIQESDGQFYCFTDNGREATGRLVQDWVREAEAKGAGEILITSVDREGTGKGFHTELIRNVAKVVRIPVIAHGGAGCAAHVRAALALEEDISAVCIASLFHYNLVQRIGINGPTNSARQNISLKRKALEDISIPQLKAYLCDQNIDVRL